MMTLLAQVSFLENLRYSVLLFIALIVSITLHEFGHAWMANRRGDPLPRSQGRVTLNPRAHMDMLGTLILPGVMILCPALLGATPSFVFGWGKPVQISLSSEDPKKRKWDDIFITLAGPCMNVLLALVASIALGISLGVNGWEDTPAVNFFGMFLSLNLVLAVFNLIPIPPLDGSRILFYLVKMKEKTFRWLARNSWWIFLLAILLPSPSSSLLGIIIRPILSILWGPFSILAQIVARAVSLFFGNGE